MVKSDRRDEALELLQKMDSEEKVKHLDLIQGSIISLIYRQTSKLEEYFSEERWNTIIDTFMAMNYEISGVTQSSLLVLGVQAGLSSLKTIYCF